MRQNYRELVVWKRGMALVQLVYETTKQFPKEEVYGLTSQLRRAAVSIPSNIAEGQSRHTPREFMRFLSTARGSLAEVETQILIAQMLGYLDCSTTERVLGAASEVGKMLNGLYEAINARAKCATNLMKLTTENRELRTDK